MSLKQNIVIVDYEVGNTYSVANAIDYLGYKKLKISSDVNVIKAADVLILPGVGAFKEAIDNLKARKLDEILEEEVVGKQKNILGICVGMQLLATQSEENGFHKGLNWIPGDVKKLELPDEFVIPHVGWNSVRSIISQPLFTRNENRNFYFDHSYHYVCDEKYVSSYCNYGLDIVASVQFKNIFGVQFHPEKSQTNGLKLFRDFFNALK